MASLLTLQVYLDQAKKESESDTKAAGVRQRAELQKLIKTAGVLRKQILANHKKTVSEEEVKAVEAVVEAVEEDKSVVEVKEEPVEIKEEPTKKKKSQQKKVKAK
jgi:hypothetical protein